MGLFKSFRTASRAIRRLHRKGLITRVGLYDVNPNEKPTQVFTNSPRRIKGDTIRTHEIPLSILLAPYVPWADEIRGPYNVDPKTLPDREMDAEGVTYRWEWYTGKQDYKQLLARLKKYAGTEDPILAVAKKVKYLAKVRAAAVEAGVSDILYTATYSSVVKDPLGKVWEASDGTHFAVTFPGLDDVPDP